MLESACALAALMFASISVNRRGSSLSAAIHSAPRACRDLEMNTEIFRWSWKFLRTRRKICSLVLFSATRGQKFVDGMGGGAGMLPIGGGGGGGGGGGILAMENWLLEDCLANGLLTGSAAAIPVLD